MGKFKKIAGLGGGLLSAYFMYELLHGMGMFGGAGENSRAAQAGARDFAGRFPEGNQPLSQLNQLKRETSKVENAVSSANRQQSTQRGISRMMAEDLDVLIANKRGVLGQASAMPQDPQQRQQQMMSQLMSSGGF